MATSLNYYAQADALGYPIPGTMMATKGAVPANARQILPQEMIANPAIPAQPDGLKYFVRRKKDGSIIPNSLIASTKRPKGLVYEVQFQLRTS